MREIKKTQWQAQVVGLVYCYCITVLSFPAGAVLPNKSNLNWEQPGGFLSTDPDIFQHLKAWCELSSRCCQSWITEIKIYKCRNWKMWIASTQIWVSDRLRCLWSVDLCLSAFYAVTCCEQSHISISCLYFRDRMMLVKGIEDTCTYVHTPAHRLNTETKPLGIQEQHTRTAVYKTVHEPHWI